MIGSGKAGRPRSDDGDLFRLDLIGELRQLQIALQPIVADESLHVVDGDGSVFLVLAVAGCLARMRADSAVHGWQRVLVSQYPPGLVQHLSGRVVK
jgi:hypothetical protein